MNAAKEEIVSTLSTAGRPRRRVWVWLIVLVVLAAAGTVRHPVAAGGGPRLHHGCGSRSAAARHGDGDRHAAADQSSRRRQRNLRDHRSRVRRLQRQRDARTDHRATRHADARGAGGFDARVVGRGRSVAGAGSGDRHGSACEGRSLARASGPQHRVAADARDGRSRGATRRRRGRERDGAGHRVDGHIARERDGTAQGRHPRADRRRDHFARDSARSDGRGVVSDAGAIQARR